MNKAYLLLISVLGLTGCNNITELFFDAPKGLQNTSVGHCRNYKVELVVKKSDPVDLINDSKANDE